MTTSATLFRRLLPTAGVFLACLLLSVALQIENRAYESDFAGHPDEAAHVVTGLMVRDYIAGGFTKHPHPLRYAERYVESFPKVALGHYPPGFYAIEGIWFLPSDSPAMALVLAAVLTAACGALIYVIGIAFLPKPAAWAAALLFCLLPLTQQYTAIVMSDTLLVLICLAATAAFVRFGRLETAKSALLFGLLAAAAILTKASGLLLALVPPLWIVLARRFDLIRKPKLWLAPIPVIALALPWMVLTYSITKEGAQDVGVAEYIRGAVPYYAAASMRVFGPLILIASAAGAVIALRSSIDLATGCVALLISGLVLFVVAPSGLDDRYLLMIAPSVILLAMLAAARGTEWLCQRFPTRPHAVRATAAAACVGLALISARGFQSEDKSAAGFSEAIDLVVEDSGGAKVIALAASDARGEGALIAAAAMGADKRPASKLLIARSSKVIADVKWLGQGFKLKFESPEALRDKLVSDFNYLIIDRGMPTSRRRADHDLAEATAAEFPADLIEIGIAKSERANGGEGVLTVYKIRPSGNAE